MTVADSAKRTANVAASDPITGQGHATVADPLPKGWGSFCSRPDSESHSHWYATPPWDAGKLREEFGEAAEELSPTVDAPSWGKLHQAVAAQIRLYERLTGETL